MPPPHSFWVILIGKTPTSFRGKMREDLVPTLRQLQRTQSDVTLRWFERGKVWESPEAAIGAAKLAATAAREKRTKEWRPGGEHRDPKARFELTRDQKRAKFKRKDDRGEHRPQSPFGPRAPKAPRPDRPWSDRSKPASFPERARPDHDRPDRARPDRARPERPWSDRPKPGGSPFPDRGPRPPRPPRGDSRAPGERRDSRAPGERRDSRDRGEGRDRPPSSDRPFGNRPPRGERRDRPSGPPGENPFKDHRRPSSGRPGRPGRPPSDRGGFKPPKRRS